LYGLKIISSDINFRIYIFFFYLFNYEEFIILLLNIKFKNLGY